MCVRRNCSGVSGLGSCLAHAGFDLRKIHDGLRDVVEVVGQDVHRDVCDRLDDFCIGQFGRARRLTLGLAELAALHDN